MCAPRGLSPRGLTCHLHVVFNGSRGHLHVVFNGSTWSSPRGLQWLHVVIPPRGLQVQVQVQVHKFKFTSSTWSLGPPRGLLHVVFTVSSTWSFSTWSLGLPRGLLHVVFKHVVILHVVSWSSTWSSPRGLQTRGHSPRGLLVLHVVFSTWSSNTWSFSTWSLGPPRGLLHVVFKHVVILHVVSRSSTWSSPRGLKTRGHSPRGLLVLHVVFSTWSSNTWSFSTFPWSPNRGKGGFYIRPLSHFPQALASGTTTRFRGGNEGPVAGTTARGAQGERTSCSVRPPCRVPPATSG